MASIQDRYLEMTKKMGLAQPKTTLPVPPITSPAPGIRLQGDENLPSRQTSASLQDYIKANPNSVGAVPVAPTQTALAPKTTTPTDQLPAPVEQTPASAPVQASTPVAQSQFDIAGEIQRLKQADLQRKISALSSARDKTLSSLDAEKSGIAPQYYDKGNQARAQSATQFKNFGEFLAQRGLSSAGVSAEGMLKNQGQLQGTLGLLNRQEQSAFDDIARRRSDANTAYETGVASASADADYSASERLLNELGTQREYARDDARYADTREDVKYGREYQSKRDDKSDSRYDQEYKDSRGDVKYNKEYQEAQDKKNDERYKMEYNDRMEQQEFENALSQNQFNEAKSQNAYVRKMQEKGFTADEAQRKWDNSFKTKQFEQSIKDGKLSQSNWQKEMTFKEAQAKIEKALAQGRLNNDNAQLALQQAKLNADNDPNSLDNQYKKAQIENIKNKGTDFDYKTDADFQATYSAAIQDQKTSLDKLKKSPQKYISAFGIDGYKALLSAATPKSQAIDYSMLENIGE